ncbi:hypothetical protein [Dysgonomonas sp. BGC7]|uniref:hypothetical protein n=1 Tax=Dysgonomonas sp. BGC7 TaxID=1658008 RepID=UPI001F55A8B7|nr:hypothetical protein [Dysgonomonas sp. BGC7]
MEKDKIKDLFSSKLSNFEPDVPASVWGGLDQILSNQPAPSVDASSASSSSSSGSATATAVGKASLIKTIAIAVGVAAAVVTGVLLIPGTEEPVAIEPKVVAEDAFEPETVQDEDTISIEEFIKSPVRKKVIVEQKTLLADVPVQMSAMPIAKDDSISEVPEKENKIEELEKPAIAEAKVILPKKNRSKGFSLGVAASANLLSENVSEQGGSLLFSHPIRTEAFNRALVKENSNFNLKHRQPISFGVTISKEIYPRLSVETGIVYTYLSSKITSNSSFNIEESQYFNYLGIPLSLNYTFYELGKARFYLSVGGMIQKDINGKYVSDMKISIKGVSIPMMEPSVYYSEPYYIRESVKQSNPQLSAHTTLGVAYPIYKKLYLYGTIGGAYYFDAGNKYSTIYSDRKTQLNLNMGLKFDF